MIKIFSKKYWIVLSSICCISVGLALACADDWVSDLATSNFTPEIFVERGYSPFFYSAEFYYGIGHDEKHISRFNDDNTREWSAWLGKPITADAVDCLLNTAGASTRDSAMKWVLKAQGAAAFRPACLSGLNDASLSLVKFVKYLGFAKRCEAFALDPILQAWEIDSTKQKKHFDATVLNRQLKEELTASKDPFLRERYWFQLLRSQFFNGNPQEAIQTFDNYQGGFPHNTIYFRSLSYTAGAYYKLKQYSRANYSYSLVYDSCEALRTVAHYSFHPQEETDWEATLSLCRNAKEKTTLWQMLGIFYSDPQRAIEEIYQLDPKSTKLNLLLSRAVNMEEGSFSVGAFLEKAGDKEIDPHRDSLRNLITRMADAGNTYTPWIWQTAAGYLDMLGKQYAAANACFRKAEGLLPHENLPQAQLRLLKLLNTIAAAPVIDRKLEQQLLPEIDWLRNNQRNDGFRNYLAFDWLKKVMAEKYALSGEKVKAECFYHESVFYTDDRNIEALKTFLLKKDKSHYESLCTSLSAISGQDIYEFQAAQLCMNDRIEEAVAAIKLADSASRVVLPGNPFNARILDCHDCDHAAVQKIKYSKGSLLDKLKELKDKIAAGQDVYTNAVLMGNAEYNITQYGNDRVFYECKIYGSDHSEPWTMDTFFVAPLTNMQTAIRYYTKALGAAMNDEQRAKCQYLLAKCQRNDWYNRTLYNDRKNWLDDRTTPNFIASDGFKALKKYPNTQYYKEVLKECGYFRTYISNAQDGKPVGSDADNKKSK